MHGRLYNQVEMKMRIRPVTPLLIKSGQDAAMALDPTLPDMNFVRTRLRTGEEVPYIPGSSFRGVLRSHGERLVRTVKEEGACNLFGRKKEQKGTLRPNCIEHLDGLDKRPAAEIYKTSCYTCRIFGNTGIAGRVQLTDLMPPEDNSLFTGVRHGVAIDRITGAVAHGPFQLETVTDGYFDGTLVMRNFTLGQLGLVAAALLDMADGLVALGYGKSRGLGRVEIAWQKLSFRFCTDPGAGLAGVGALAGPNVREQFSLPAPEEDRLALPELVTARRGGFWEASLEGMAARHCLEQLAPLWTAEV